MVETKTLRAFYDLALDVTHTVSDLIREQYTQPHTITKKAPKDIVTETDTLVQETAIDLIQKQFPDHLFLAEEDPTNKGDEFGVYAIPSEPTWVIDPVDGTSNFATGLPFFCFSIGLAIEGQSRLGVLCDPIRHEVFSAIEGEGAWLNGEKLPPIKSHKLHDSIVGMDWAKAPGAPLTIRQLVDGLSPRCRTTRVMGSAALAMAYVSVGRIGLYTHLGLKPWDTAAASIIIQESGGVIRQPTGEAWQFGQPALLAGHPDLIDEALEGLI